MRKIDAIRGSLIGGAAGDALGYAVEFMREKEIFERWGESGITRYELSGGLARISDDTQMTLFTAEGLILAEGGEWAKSVNSSYLDWLATQEEFFPLKGEHRSRLLDEKGLFSRRAPGNTCLAALRMGGGGSPERPVNKSKGCGGVMRVAPVGLFFAGSSVSIEESDRVAAHAAALTHGHPFGYLPAAVLAHTVRRIVEDGAPVFEAATDALDTVKDLWWDTPGLADFAVLIRKSLRLAREAEDDLGAIHALGEGWAGDEALAIALFCAARYPDDIDRALIASVNHNGDSDSTGAIAGNIVGANVGLEGVPQKYTETLELRDLIIETADRLCGAEIA